jgi:hypothetical protein
MPTGEAALMKGGWHDSIHIVLPPRWQGYKDLATSFILHRAGYRRKEVRFSRSIL